MDCFLQNVKRHTHVHTYRVLLRIMPSLCPNTQSASCLCRERWSRGWWRDDSIEDKNDGIIRKLLCVWVNYQFMCAFRCTNDEIHHTVGLKGSQQYCISKVFHLNLDSLFCWRSSVACKIAVLLVAYVFLLALFSNCMAHNDVICIYISELFIFRQNF